MDTLPIQRRKARLVAAPLFWTLYLQNSKLKREVRHGFEFYCGNGISEVEGKWLSRGLDKKF
jgi:hypothetical protein